MVPLPHAYNVCFLSPFSHLDFIALFTCRSYDCLVVSQYDSYTHNSFLTQIVQSLCMKIFLKLFDLLNVLLSYGAYLFLMVRNLRVYACMCVRARVSVCVCVCFDNQGNLSAKSNSNLSINSNGSESDDSTKPRLRGILRPHFFVYILYNCFIFTFFTYLCFFHCIYLNKFYVWYLKRKQILICNELKIYY